MPIYLFHSACNEATQNFIVAALRKDGMSATVEKTGSNAYLHTNATHAQVSMSSGKGWALAGEVFVTAQTAKEHHAHIWHADAAELKIAPGVVPEFLLTNLGNGLPFVLVRYDALEFVYAQANGALRLTVFND